MNSLEVAVTQENGLSFALVVDGKPIGELLNDGNEGIPFWLVSNGLPTFPPSGPDADPLVRIVSVCGCGEYGCGHSRCKVEHQGDVITFFDFEGDVGAKGKALRFVFPSEQYTAAAERIMRLANEYKGTEG